jgi:hypothetical protein
MANATTTYDPDGTLRQNVSASPTGAAGPGDAFSGALAGLLARKMQWAEEDRRNMLEDRQRRLLGPVIPKTVPGSTARGPILGASTKSRAPVQYAQATGERGQATGEGGGERATGAATTFADPMKEWARKIVERGIPRKYNAWGMLIPDQEAQSRYNMAATILTGASAANPTPPVVSGGDLDRGADAQRARDEANYIQFLNNSRSVRG